MRRTWTKLAGAGMAAALTASLAAAGMAEAHNVSTPTDIHVIEAGFTGASGHVLSSKDRCKVRKLVLRKVGGSVASNDTSDSSGAFELNSSLDAGDYKIIVTRKVLRNTSPHTHACARATHPFTLD